MAASIKALLATMAIMVIADVAFATNYTVGKPGGSWDLQTNYKTWVSDKTFYTGDNLIFSYTSAHDVVEVSKADYAACLSGDGTVYKTGNTIYELTEAGTRYFICAVPNHCKGGMLVEIEVVAKSDSPPAPPPSDQATAPSPAAPPSPKASSPTKPLSPLPKSGVAGNNVGLIATIVLGFGSFMLLA